MFSVAQRSGFDAVGLMLDCPPADQADPASYIAVIDEFIAASADTPTRAAIISSLPESLFAETRERCFAAGIVPLQGQRQALEALALAAAVGKTWSTGPRIELRLPNRPWEGACAIAEAANEPPSPGRKLAPMDRELAPSDCEQALPGRELPPPGRGAARARKEHTLTEHEGKAALAAFGVRVPRSAIVAPGDAAAAAGVVGFPVVMKAASPTLEHKSDVGGVILNIRTHTDAEAAAERLARLSDILLVEEMATDAVAEILIGMTADAQFGQVLVIGAGGILTELLRDTVTLLPPFTPSAIEAAIKTLSVHKLLTGFRGRPLADIPALVETALACTRYAAANVNTLVELDINPVIVRPAGRGAIAVDALIRLG
jgi:acetyl-CoA synthetase